MTSELLFSSVYARLLLRAEIAGLENVSQQALLENTGITEADLNSVNFSNINNNNINQNKNAYLAWPQIRALLANIKDAGATPDWPIRFAEQLTIASHGPMGFAALSAANLESALHVLIDYHAIRTATINAALEKSDAEKNTLPASHCQLVINELTGDAIYGRQIAETTIKVVLTVIETIIGHSLNNHVQLQFAYPPPDNQNILQAMQTSLAVECNYNCEQTVIVFPVSWLGIVSPLYDEAVYRANIIKCREQIQALYQQSNDPVAIVKNRLAHYFEQNREAKLTEPLPDLNQCAALLNLSPRTFIRRLETQGQSYKALLRAVRMEHALDMLSNTYLGVNDIADRLGYADASNFVRAFRQWFDQTPAAWRKKHSH